jgi:hypothetical protein
MQEQDVGALRRCRIPPGCLKAAVPCDDFYGCETSPHHAWALR